MLFGLFVYGDFFPSRLNVTHTHTHHTLTQVHLLNVPTVWRLPLLEGLFSLLFLKSSDIRETLSSERDQNDDDDDDDDDDVKRKSPQFIVTAALIRGLLGVLEDCLEHDEKDDEKDETLKRRAERLRKHVKESRERMETLVDTEKHWRRSPSELMGRMLASPLSLLHVCLKQRKCVVFERDFQSCLSLQHAFRH